MKQTYVKLLVIAALLIVLGVVAFPLQPGEPESVCATGNVTSGYFDKEKNCPISVESMREIGEYLSAPKVFRIAGVVLIVAGVGVGIGGLVSFTKSRRRQACAEVE
ncbi:hypothetical protein [Sciscionella sediminilitoris]|uniref:hypothetical protein n=1 Tax=Sciscionella sediminilitoris TaxID=1445613 RepID=UPI0004DF5C78|nr:hypothetical protein [Sciscionella sp. SE31]